MLNTVDENLHFNTLSVQAGNDWRQIVEGLFSEEDEVEYKLVKKTDTKKYVRVTASDKATLDRILTKAAEAEYLN